MSIVREQIGFFVVAVVNSRIVTSTRGNHSSPGELEETSWSEAEDIVSNDSVKSVKDECCGEVRWEFRAVEFQPSCDSSDAVIGVDVRVH